MKSELLSTSEALQAFLNRVHDEQQKQVPVMYIDLEGNNLSRHGSLSLITILLEGAKKVHLVDITALKSTAFAVANSVGQTLKDILESKDIIKVFFDIRNDSDALFGLYGVRVDGIEDLQLQELASRDFSKSHVKGLAKCIERDADISFSEKVEWRNIKEQGQRLFAPERGGSYAVFDQRPLSPIMLQYCCQDVTLMPRLRKIYRQKLCDAWWLKIEEETAARIKSSQGTSYNGKGRHKAMGPTGWSTWSPTMQERQSRALLHDSACIAKSAPEMKQSSASKAQDANSDCPTIALQALSMTDQSIGPSLSEAMKSGRNGDHSDSDNYNHNHSQVRLCDDSDDDNYPDTARDCIGWEDDMVMRGSPF